MKVQIVGKEDIDYTNKVGKHVVGVKLYSLFESKRVTGYQADNAYFAVDNPAFGDAQAVAVGDYVDFVYNRFGSVEGIAPCSKK